MAPNPKTSFPFLVLAAVLVLAALPVRGDSNPAARTYPSDFAAVQFLFQELHTGLDASRRTGISPDMLALVPESKAFMRLTTVNSRATVQVSAGFIDLVNRIAHAKAIDTIQKGYMKGYVAALAASPGSDATVFPAHNDPKFWTEEVMEEQKGCFAGMVSMVLAVNMSEVYLGQYDKHKARLSQDSSAAFHDLLTEKEWDEAFTAGLKHAMAVGYMIDGNVAIVVALDALPAKPAWANSFFPTTKKLSQVKKSMQKLQGKFFAGDD